MLYDGRLYIVEQVDEHVKHLQFYNNKHITGYATSKTLIYSLWSQSKHKQVGRGADTGRHLLPVGVGAEALIRSLGSQELWIQVGCCGNTAAARAACRCWC